MPTITLQFQTPQDLSGFKNNLELNGYTINIRELTLTCSCCPEQIELATYHFGAKVLKIKQEAQSRASGQ
ncbi:MAG: hypothetical protein JWP69_961 [Flaviaesturariibacter sp.]|nr:hypothetical protein [Flaviaesturariibacter sp.]